MIGFHPLLLPSSHASPFINHLNHNWERGWGPNKSIQSGIVFFQKPFASIRHQVPCPEIPLWLPPPIGHPYEPIQWRWYWKANHQPWCKGNQYDLIPAMPNPNWIPRPSQKKATSNRLLTTFLSYRQRNFQPQSLWVAPQLHRKTNTNVPINSHCLIPTPLQKTAWHSNTWKSNWILEGEERWFDVHQNRSRAFLIPYSNPQLHYSIMTCSS